MLRLKLQEALAKKSFTEGRRIDWIEVASHTDIHRVTLSKLMNHRGYNTSMSILDRLCRYFSCKIEDLVEYVPDELLEGTSASSIGNTEAAATSSQAGPKKLLATIFTPVKVAKRGRPRAPRKNE